MTYDMNFPKLKPCPFDGSDEVSTYHYKVGKRMHDEFGIYCNGCDKSVTSDEGWKTEEQAIEAWNERSA